MFYVYMQIITKVAHACMVHQMSASPITDEKINSWMLHNSMHKPLLSISKHVATLITVSNLQQSQQAIVSLSKQLGQQLETAAIQEVDSLSRKLDHECHQTATMKQEIDSLSTTLSQERHQLATVKQEKFNLETISQEQSKQLDIALSKLKDLEQQHAMLEESFHQATEIGRANEAMIEKLKEELSTANNEVSISINITVFILFHIDPILQRKLLC